MPLTTPQDFKAAAARRRKTVDVELDGLTVRLRALSAGDAVRFQSEVRKAGEDGEALSFTLIARSWIGEDGELLMPEEEGEAFARTLDADTFTKLAKAVLALNGLSEKAIEEAEKNLTSR